ncbi:unnamed protein product [Linum tenue]|uniref:Uncharacterized protein n=1 Tax=Linum tenue TaxID=586396 RepID=A0AAV0L4F6_9ROSI|nr:unnamed protein product [Linum tenue]
MIFVDGNPFPATSSQGKEVMFGLMEHPAVVAASDAFKSFPERKFSVLEDPGLQDRRWVYLFQREYATVDPSLVDVNALPFPMDDAFLYASSPSTTKQSSKLDGYSLPLCTKVVEALGKRQERFHMRTLFILGHNTKWDAQNIAYPIFNGLLVETSTGSVFPACFDRTTRCPDEVVRRIRVSASYEDPTWKGKLLDTYDTRTDQFVIAPCSWSFYQLNVAFALQNLSDEEILLQCSTSPSAEGPDFVNNLKRQWEYLFRHPKWQETFPRRQARVFVRSANGNWDLLPLSEKDAFDHVSGI